MNIINAKKNDRNFSRIFLSLNFFLALLFFIFYSFSFSQAEVNPPNIITYQGKILNGGETLNEVIPIKFSFYNTSTLGTPIYTASGTTSSPTAISVSVSDGFFSINLGDASAGFNVLGDIFVNNSAVYLEVTVNNEILTPRKQITAAPYVTNSTYLNGLAPTSTTQISQYIPMSDGSGNFQFNGVTTTQLNISNLNTTNATFTNATSTNSFWSNIINAVTGVFSNLTWTNTTSTGNTTLNNLTTTGDSDFATTTISSLLSVIGNTTFGTITSGTWAGNVLSATYGGTGQDSSEWIGLAGLNAGVWSASAVNLSTQVIGLLSPTYGGTNTTTFLNNGVIFSDGTKFTQDINNLFWDSTSSSLGINTSSPQARLHLYDGMLLVDSPINPNITASVTTSINGFLVSGNYVYITDHLSKLKIFDATDKNNLVQISTTTFGVENPSDVAIKGRYAYIADLVSPGGILIADISNPANPVYIKKFTTTTLNYSSKIKIVGKYAYLLGNFGRLSILDISNPLNPIIIGSVSDPSKFDAAGDFQVVGNYVYISGRVPPSSIYRLFVIDISNPHNPQIIADTNSSLFSSFTSNLEVDGGYVYVCSDYTNTLGVFDTNNPYNPSLISTVEINDPERVVVSGDFAYVFTGDNKIVIVDKKNNTNLRIVGSKTLPESSFSQSIVGKFLYLRGNGNLYVLDLEGADISTADIGNISTDSLTVFENIDVSGGIIIHTGLNVGSGGIYSNGPMAMVVSTTVSTATLFSVNNNSVNNILAVNSDDTVNVAGNLSIIGNFTYTGDISPSVWNGSFISSTYGGTGANSSDWTGFANILNGGWATTSLSFVSDFSGILSVQYGGTGVSSSVATGSIIFSNGTSLPGDGNLFWNNLDQNLGVGTSSPSSQLHIYGGTLLVDKPSTTLITTFDPSIGNPDSSAVFYTEISKNLAYMFQTNGINIVDVSNKTAPALLGFYKPIDWVGTTGIYAGGLSGHYAYLVGACPNLDTFTDDLCMQVVDVANSSNPFLVNSVFFDNSLSITSDYDRIYFRGKYAYMPTAFEGVLVFDLSDPIRPVLVGRTTGVGYVYDAYLSGQYLYIGDASGADGSVKILDLTIPTNPTIVSTISSSAYLKYPQGIYISGKYAYVANSQNTFSVLDISNPATPMIIGTTTFFAGGPNTTGLYVSGKYAYVISHQTINVIDISNPTVPIVVNSMTNSAFFSQFKINIVGKYAYTYTVSTNDLKIIDLSGADISTADIGNMATNNFTVWENTEINNKVSIKNSLNVGPGGVLSGGPMSIFVSGLNSTSTAFAAYSDYSCYVVGECNTPLFSVLSNGTVMINTSTINTTTLNTLSSYKLIVDAGGSSNAGIGVNGFIQASGYITGTTTLDLAETYPINLNCEKDNTCPAPGDVVCVDPSIVAGVKKCSINDIPIGIVSTNPGFLLGGGILSNPNSNPGTVKVALSGRVPVKVKGIISPGDKLTISQVSGVAIKATSNQPTIGIAMENFPNNLTTSTVGTVVGFVNLGEYNKLVKNNILSITTTNNGQLVYNGGDLELNGNLLKNVSAIYNSIFIIDDTGHFITKFNTANGLKNMYVMQSPTAEFVFSSSSQLVAGETKIEFDQTIKDIIDPDQSLKITVTLTSNEAKGLFVTEKSAQGFTVKEVKNGTSNASFDWMVVAKRKDYTAPIATPVDIVPTTSINTAIETPTTTASSSTVSVASSIDELSTSTVGVLP